MFGYCAFCQTQYKKREKERKFCSILCANRSHKNRLVPITLPPFSASLAELVGVLLGDGYVSKYQVSVTLNSIADRDYTPFVCALFCEIFPDIKVTAKKRSTENAIEIRANSTLAATYLRQMGIIPHQKRVPTWIRRNKKYTLACIRGLFDTEGSISFKRYTSLKGITVHKQLNFRGIDPKIMEFVRDGLLTLGLKPTKTLKKSLYISNDQAIMIFREKIGFSNPKLLKRSMIKTYEEYLQMIAESEGATLTHAVE